MQHATLCYLLRDGGDEVLLIRKQRGLGEGLYVGPGGKVEEGETPRECVVREVREEIGVTVHRPLKLGEFEFEFGDDLAMFVHVFRSSEFDGDAEASPEAEPEWFAVEDVPYDEMWEDDRLWLPHLLDGEPFEASFRFDEDGEELLAHEVETDVEFD